MKYNVWVDIEQEDEDGILSKFDDGESVATFDNEKDATEHAAQLGSLKPKADKPLLKPVSAVTNYSKVLS